MTAEQQPASLGLSPRQRECLLLTNIGMNSKEIGAALGLSNHTVDNHIKKALIALKVSDRRAAGRLAAIDAASHDLTNDWLDQTLAIVRAGGMALHQGVQEQPDEVRRDESGTGNTSGTANIDLEHRASFDNVGEDSTTILGGVFPRWIEGQSPQPDRVKANHRDVGARHDPASETGRTKFFRPPITSLERMILLIAAVCVLFLVASVIIDRLTALLHTLSH